MGGVLTLAGCVAATAPVLGCGGGERAAPNPGELAIVKPETNSGDQQVGVAGGPLAQDLRVLVTRDGVPAESVVVTWSTPEGTLSPVSATTGPDGISSAKWTLQRLFAQQVAFAGLDPGKPPDVTFTAIATPDPRARNTVLVGGPGGNQFDPAELTIMVGDTVNWLWPEGSAGHNVEPDDGDTPPHSGAVGGYPKFHSFRFEAVGVFRYHCQAHGAAGGVGMSGTITVVPSGPLP